MVKVATQKASNIYRNRSSETLIPPPNIQKTHPASTKYLFQVRHTLNPLSIERPYPHRDSQRTRVFVTQKHT